MTLLVSDAVVLHVFPYLESSRIIRLLTRERGIVSVLARGARRPKSRFGTALDLFVSGAAQISVRESRELQTLSSFEVTRARPRLGEDLGRFAGASAIAELTLRATTEEEAGPLFDTISDALDRLADADPTLTAEVTLRGAWHVVRALGFAPTLEHCASCHAAIPPDRPAAFSSRAGGALCSSCAALSRGTRLLPADALAALDTFFGDTVQIAKLEDTALRAHQRLLREFVQEHVGDGRALRAYESWERGVWNVAV